MDIHPEAVKLLNKHRGTDFRAGGEHYVENLTATNAISEALNERDTLRTQVAAMREALPLLMSEAYRDGSGRYDGYPTPERLERIIATFWPDAALSTLKDQSNDH